MWHPKAMFPGYLKQASVEEKYNYFVSGFSQKHKRILSIHEEIREKFFSSREQTIGLVIGPTGVGKSHLASNLMTEAYKNIESSSDLLHELPMIYIEANVLGRATFSWKDFYEDILIATGEQKNIRVYGRPKEPGIAEGSKYSTRNRTEAELKRDAIDRLVKYKVRYLLIDEIQHIFKYGGGTGEKSLDILKSFASRAGCRILGLGTYGISFSIERSSELARRILEIHFAPYSMDSPSDIYSFEEAFIGLLASIPIEIDERLIDFSSDAFVGSCGCVGILKEWMERSLNQALNSDSPILSVDNFRLTRLKGSQLKQIAEDLKEGKAFFAEPEDSEIWSLLGGNKKQDSGLSPTQRKSSSVIKPGQRKPGRDKVGI